MDPCGNVLICRLMYSTSLGILLQVCICNWQQCYNYANYTCNYPSDDSQHMREEVYEDTVSGVCAGKQCNQPVTQNNISGGQSTFSLPVGSLLSTDWVHYPKDLA